MSDGRRSRVPAPPNPLLIRVILSGGAALSLVVYDLVLHWFTPNLDVDAHGMAIVGMGVALIVGTALTSHVVFTRLSGMYERTERQRQDLEIENERLSAGRLPTQRRAAYTLHEVVAQDLSACRALLSAASSSADPDDRADLLRRVDGVIGGVIANTRRIAADLSPGIFEELGLAVALDVLADSIGRSKGIPVRADVNPCWRLLSVAAQSELRDTLTDVVARAADIKEVTFIDLKIAPDGERLVAQIAFDGQDLMDPPCQRGYLAQSRGTCSVTPVGDSGTAVELAMPLEPTMVASSTSR